MKITVRNQAKVPNKYIRFTKWKLWRIKRKFESLLYSELFIKKEGSLYKSVLKLGVKGQDLIITSKHRDLSMLMKESTMKTERYMAEYNRRQKEVIRSFNK